MFDVRSRWVALSVLFSVLFLGPILLKCPAWGQGFGGGPLPSRPLLWSLGIELAQTAERLNNDEAETLETEAAAALGGKDWETALKLLRRLGTFVPSRHFDVRWSADQYGEYRTERWLVEFARRQKARAGLLTLKSRLGSEGIQDTPARRKELNDALLVVDWKLLSLLDPDLRPFIDQQESTDFYGYDTDVGAGDLRWWWRDAAQRPGKVWDWSSQRPRDVQGNLQFLKLPTTLEEAGSRGERALFLLDEIQRLDAAPFRHAVGARLYRAQIAAKLLGPEHDPHWNQAQYLYQFDQEPAFYEEDSGEEVKPWHLLADGEVRLGIHNEAHLFRIPDSENPLHMWKAIERDFPGSPAAHEAIFASANWHLSRRHFAQAKAEFERYLATNPDDERKKLVQHKLDVIAHGDVRLGRTRVALAGTRPELWFACRNAARVEFTARRVDLEAYIRHKAQEGDFTLLPDDDYGFNWFGWGTRDELESPRFTPRPIQWIETVRPSDQVERHRTRAPLTAPGAYLVTATLPDVRNAKVDNFESDEPTSVLVVLSHVAIVQSHQAKQVTHWLVDAETGRPLPQEQAQLRQKSERTRSQWASHTTDAAGRLAVQVMDDTYSFLWTTGLRGSAWSSFEGLWSGSSDPSDNDIIAEGVTNRTLYRPGDTVHYRFWLREGAHAMKRPRDGQAFSLAVDDARHERLLSQSATVDRHGCVTGSFVIPTGSSLGRYQIRLEQSSGTAVFEVEEYRKPEFEVTLVPMQETVELGKEGAVQIRASYYFGGPVAEAEVEFTVTRTEEAGVPSHPQEFDWLYGSGYGVAHARYEWLGDPPPEDSGYYGYGFGSAGGELAANGNLKLGVDGTAVIRFPTEASPDTTNVTYAVTATVRDASRRSLDASTSVTAVRNAGRSSLSFDRNWYTPRDALRVQLQTLSANYEGTACKGRVRVAKVSLKADKPELRDVHVLPAETDQAGLTALEVPPLTAGLYRLIFEPDPAAPVPCAPAAANVWVIGDGLDVSTFPLSGLEMVPDRPEYRTGDTVKLLVLAKPTTAHLWVHTGDRPMFDPVRIDDHVRVLEIPVLAEHVPNFDLNALLVGGGEQFSAQALVYVPPRPQMLRVEVAADKAIYRPGNSGQLRLKVSDAEGRPVSGPATVSLYDKSLLAMAPEVNEGPRALWKQLVQQTWWFEDSGLRASLGHRFYASGQFVCPEYHAEDEVGWIGGIGGSGPEPSDATPLELERELRAVRGQVVFGGGMGGFGGAFGGAFGGGAPPAPPPRRPVPIVREDVDDAPLWIPSLDLDAKGEAVAEVRFPQALTTWRVRVWAVTDDTQIGEATLDLVATRDLLVRLAQPRSLVSGDSAVVSSIVHNSSPQAQDATVELLVPDRSLRPSQAGGMLTDGVWTLSKAIRIAGGAEQRLDWPLMARNDGEATLTTRVLAADDADAVKATLPIQPRGTWAMLGRSGALRLQPNVSERIEFELPADTVPERTELKLSLSPTAAAAMLDALPYLAGYPYGCVEQTMSRFYPTVLARRALRDLGIDAEALSKRARKRSRFDSPVASSQAIDDMARQGLTRLYRFQHEDGGWGWWEHDPSKPYMTAYVLLGLADARDAGLPVNDYVLRQGAHYLSRHVLDDDSSQGHQAALAAYVLSRPTYQFVLRESDTVEKAVKAALDRLIANPKPLSAYGQILLALALHHRRDERAADFLQPLLETLTRDKGIAWLRTAGDRWQWWSHDVETNAWLLRALVAMQPDSELVPRLMAGLAVHRTNGVAWDSTRDSALAVAALAEACRIQKVNELEVPVRVQVDDEPALDMTLSWANVVAGEAVLVRRQQPLAPGAHALSLSSPQAAGLFYGLEVRLLQTGEQAVGSPELQLTRAYSRVDRRTGQLSERLAEGAVLAVGEVVEVELRVTNKNPRSYLAFEDPMPGGCVPYQLYGSWDTLYGHREARIGKTTLFTDWLHPGEHTLRYRVRTESPGTFRALPASVFDMYHPEIRANTTGFGILVRPGP